MGFPTLVRQNLYIESGLSRSLSLSYVSEPPEWTHYGQMQEDRHMQRPVGSLVRLRCRASGHPRPAMLWFFGSAVITGEEEHVELDQTLPEDRHSLRMQNVQPLHSGNYMCRAFNHLGRINFTYTLEVVGKYRNALYIYICIFIYMYIYVYIYIYKCIYKG